MSVCPGEHFITRHHTASSLPLLHIPTTHCHVPLMRYTGHATLTRHHLCPCHTSPQRTLVLTPPYTTPTLSPMAHIPDEAHEAHQRMRVRGGARCRDHRHDALSEPQFRASSTKTEKKKTTRSCRHCVCWHCLRAHLVQRSKET